MSNDGLTDDEREALRMADQTLAELDAELRAEGFSDEDIAELDAIGHRVAENVRRRLDQLRAVPARVRSLCDALEWLLVAWGRPRTGRVTVCSERLLGPERVWTNKPPFDGTPEACLYLEVHPNMTTHYTLGGSPAWVLANAGESPTGVRKVLDAILAEGWQVQGLDAEGVEVAKVSTKRSEA